MTMRRQTYPLRLVWWRVGQHLLHSKLDRKKNSTNDMLNTQRHQSRLPLLSREWGSLQTPQTEGCLVEESLEEEFQVVGCMEGESLGGELWVHMLEHLEEVVLVEASRVSMAQEDLQHASQVGGSSS